jgi:hypothetical protein
MKNEEWKQIKNYDYEACADGKIRNKKTGRILKQRIGDLGYYLVDIQIDKKNKTFKAHRLIAEAFLGPGEEGWHIDHINRIRSDNRIKNLRWVTPNENMENRAFGEITSDIIDKIISLHKKGKTTQEIHLSINKK